MVTISNVIKRDQISLGRVFIVVFQRNENGVIACDYI